MSDRYDVIVAGLGAMGSAAAYHLAARGLRVVGLDRFAPPHARGSSHGESRVIREAYFEHPSYVPLVRRAFDQWEALQAEFGQQLLRRTGALMLGPREGMVIQGSLESARAHHVPHEMMSPDEVRLRFPALRPQDDQVGLLEYRAGVLFPEVCIEAHLAGAAARGARLLTGEALQGWARDGEGVRVTTAEGEIRAGALVLATGAWMTPDLLGMDLRLRVERQVMHWFAPGAVPRTGPEECPVTLWEGEAGGAFYTVPDLGTGLKAALHHGGAATTADSVDRTVTAYDTAPVERLASECLAGVRGGIGRSTTCLYTNTADGHFIVDRHPDCASVVLVSACSGHGFKFASAIGAAVASMVAGDPPDPVMDFFTLSSRNP